MLNLKVIKYESLHTGLVAFVLAFFMALNPAIAADSYRVNDGATKFVDEHGICWQVENNSGEDIYVPTITLAEWREFIHCAEDGQPKDTSPACDIPGGVTGVTLSPCVVDCTLDGTNVPDGDSITAYMSTRNCGQSCGDIDQVRNCNTGTLDGSASYSEASCPAMTPCLNCSSTDGVVIPHGTSDILYTSTSVSCGSSCAGQSRTCNDGTLSGNASYEYANCTENCADCGLVDGVTVPHNTSETFYNSSSGTCGTPCSARDQSRFCNDGSLSGSYTHASCSDPVCFADCTLDGVTVPHGDSRTFYSAPTGPCGPDTCADIGQSRTCTNGTLDGSSSYNNAFCSEPSCWKESGSPPLPPPNACVSHQTTTCPVENAHDIPCSPVGNTCTSWLAAHLYCTGGGNFIEVGFVCTQE